MKKSARYKCGPQSRRGDDNDNDDDDDNDDADSGALQISIHLWSSTLKFNNKKWP